MNEELKDIIKNCARQDARRVVERGETLGKGLDELMLWDLEIPDEYIEEAVMLFEDTVSAECSGNAESEA